MKNTWKRMLSLLLVLCLCVGMFPSAALAEDAEDSAPAENDTPDVAPVEADAPGDPEPDAPEALTFTVQPEDGEIPAGERCAVFWALSFEPERQELLRQEADESGELLLSLAEELPADARSWEITEPGTYRVRAWLGEDCALSEAFTVVEADVSGSPEAGEEGDSLAAPGETEDPLQPAEPAAPPEGEPRADLEPEEEMDALPADGEINASSGTCGDNLTWTLDDVGTLTISGTGPMENYTERESAYTDQRISTAPWYHYSEQILSVVIGSGVTSIGDYAFYKLYCLTSVTIPGSVTSIGDWAFYYCSSLTSVTIPEGVTSIGDRAFSCCSSLTSVTIPGIVTSIGDYAFSGCSSLASVTIPEGVTSIGDRAFSSCSSLTSVTIPSSVTSIGDYAFSYCRSLTSVIFEEGVTNIGAWMFSACRNLTSVEIPASVTSIGYCAFSCWNGNSYSHYADSDYAGSLSRVKLAAGSQLRSIGGSAFENQPRLQPFRLPGPLESIGSYAFAFCTDYVNLTLPDSVTSLGSSAFLRSGVQTAVLSAGLTQLPASLFESCYSLKTVTIPEGVTKIGERAFYWCYNLQNAALPASVTEIGKEAFRNTDLHSLDLSHVQVIGDYAFAYLDGWSSNQPALRLDLSSATSLGKYAFARDYSVYSDGSGVDRYGPTFTVILNPNTRVVPEGLFRGARIASLTLPDGLTEIGYAAFQGSGLTGITLPGSLTALGSYAFAESALGRVEIPAGVDEIPQSCFYRCYDLRAAIVPKTVEYFGANAFAECPLLTMYGSSPSAAKDYAGENGIPFKALGSAPAAVSALKLSAAKLTLDGPKTQKELTLSIQPSGAVTGAIQWTSSDSSVVYVYEKSGTGGKTAVLYAQGLGTATVTVSAGGLSASCEVTVPAKLTGLSLPQNLSLLEGSTGEITVYPKPEQASLDSATVTWKSSNTKVLQVNGLNGGGPVAELVGVAPGTATVTVTVGKLSAKTTVTVLQQPVESLNLRREGESALLNDGELTLALVSGAKLQLSAEREPASATAKLNWTSSDTKVATVSDGTVTLKGAGSTVITVRAADSAGATAAFRLNVLDLKPRLSAATVTVNSYLEAGTPLEILPAEDSEIIGAELLLKKNGAFVPLDALDFTPTEGNGYELRYPGLGKVSYSAYVRAEVWCERIGQSVSFELPLKINVVNTAPKVKITLEKVNTFYPEHSFAVTAAVTNGTLKEYVLAETSNPYFELDESGDLILSEEARAPVAANPQTVLNKQPVVFQVWCEGGKPDAPITVSVKPAVTYAKPTVKLGALRFNRFYTDREYPLPLTVNNGEVAHVELAAESSPCFDLDPASRTLSLNRTAWARLAADPKAKFSEAVVLKVQLADVDEVFTVSAKPTVSRTVPKLYLADVETGAKLSALTYNDFLGKDTARFAIYDASTKAPAPISEITSASAVFEPAVLDSAAGAAQLQKVGAAAPAKTVLTVSSETWDAPLTLSVSFKYEKQPTVAYNAAGKLDLLLRSSTEIIYTPKISNAAGAEVMDIELLSITDAKGNPVEEELFELDFQAELGTARLRLVPGAEIAKAKYNLVLGTTLELDGVQNQLESKVIVTPTQSKLTLKSGSTKLNVVTGGSAYAYVYAQPEGVRLQRLAVTGTLPAGLSVSCNRVTGEVIFNAAEGMKKGTYSVKLAAEAVGAAEGTAASTLVFKITVK